MRFTLTSIILSLLLVACSRQPKPQELSEDAKLRQKITGAWFASNAIIEFDPDGSSTSHVRSGKNAWTYLSTWDVKDGYVVMTITNVAVRNTTNYETVGTLERCKIISVDETNVIWESSGQKISFERIR